jgi:aryl-alcohol dehydrogenase-like predicted oxidoreductase
MGLQLSCNGYNQSVHFVLIIYELFADATVSQVAIAWLLHRPSVASVVIGARTLEQLEENLQSVNLHLSKEEVCVL